jgi:signal peptidase I
VTRKVADKRSSIQARERDSFYGQFSTTDKKGREEREKTARKHRENLQLLLLMVVAFDVVFGFIRPFVVEPMYVPSESMLPTLQVGDRVLTNKLAYDFLSSPERGDLVVFKDIGKEKDEDTVKRVIGLPGDEISVEDGTLLVNGSPPYEPYLNTEEGATQETPALETFGPVFVPKDHVFVMGDNRANSYDSRFFGPVPNENIVGKVSLRFWPTDRLGIPA